MSGPAPTVRIDRLALIGLAASAGGAAAAGLAGAVGALFCWYVVDAARQQARVSRATTAGTQTRSEALHLWLAAMFAILIVAASAPHMVMGVPLDLPRPPSQLIIAAGLAYSIAVVDWIVRALARWRLGENPWAAFTGEAALHLALLTAFAICADVSAGVTGLVAYRLCLALLPEGQRLPSSAG
jgi:hypothetical protein